MPSSLPAALSPSPSSIIEPSHCYSRLRSALPPYRRSCFGSNLCLVGLSQKGCWQKFPTVQASIHLSVLRDSQAPGLSKFQDFDPTAMLLKQRIIFLGSQVDDFAADVIISQLLLLDADDPSKDIKLLINSPGGSVTAGMGIYDAIKLCKADVSTVCFGLAASMGAFLLASGTRGKRFCMPNSRVMIHQPLGGAGGSAMEVGLQVREMMYHKIKLTKIMARLTGKSEDQIELDTDRDHFMNAWEAAAYGLVDAVVDDGKPGLVAPIGESKEPPKSKVWDYWTVKVGKERKTLPSEVLAPTKHKDDKPGKGNGSEMESKEEEAAAAV